jgi:hypothetical protein
MPLAITRQPRLHFYCTEIYKKDEKPKYPYFDVVVGLVWSHDPKSYAGGKHMLLVGPPVPDRSRVMIQTKRDNLVLQVGGLAWG